MSSGYDAKTVLEETASYRYPVVPLPLEQSHRFVPDGIGLHLARTVHVRLAEREYGHQGRPEMFNVTMRINVFVSREKSSLPGPQRHADESFSVFQHQMIRSRIRLERLGDTSHHQNGDVAFFIVQYVNQTFFRRFPKTYGQNIS